MTDYELALRYLPRFYRDKNEPFAIQAVGYSVLRASGKSPSSPRELTLHSGAAVILEYAVFFDFDIQHLYDLEHVFLYLDADGQVVDAEASFHGWFFRSMFEGVLKFEDQTHPIFYMQPGKHAMMPDPRLFYLYRELYAACDALCGNGGFLVDPMFAGELSTDEQLDKNVHRYLQKKYSFVPAMAFEPAPKVSRLMPFEELHRWIVHSMRQWAERLKREEPDG